tara:strand:+ start:2186 stop:2428 length:243 start_codon:yes stop_codon:yes gene_type:complete
MTMFFEVGVPSFISLKEEREKKEFFEKRGKKHVIFFSCLVHPAPLCNNQEEEKKNLVCAVIAIKQHTRSRDGGGVSKKRK